MLYAVPYSFFQLFSECVTIFPPTTSENHTVRGRRPITGSDFHSQVRMYRAAVFYRPRDGRREGFKTIEKGREIRHRDQRRSHARHGRDRLFSNDVFEQSQRTSDGEHRGHRHARRVVGSRGRGRS